jgi:hypothetical protein
MLAVAETCADPLVTDEELEAFGSARPAARQKRGRPVEPLEDGRARVDESYGHYLASSVRSRLRRRFSTLGDL